MSERRDTSPEVSRLFIPERQFWTDEAAEIYLDDDGRLKQPDSEGNYPYELLEKPLISDEFPVVDIPAFAEQVKGLFIPNSKFPRIYRKDISKRLAAAGISSGIDHVDIRIADNIEHVQEQKHFREQRKVIDMEDYRFCNNVERTMIIPQTVNSLLPFIAAEVPKPVKDVMRPHRIGADASAMMLRAAVLMERRGHGFSARKKSLTAGSVVPGTPIEEHTGIDRGAAEHFREQSRTIKEMYKVAQWLYFEGVPDNSYFAQFKEQVVNSRPRGVINILGSVATLTPWDYTAYFRGTADIDTTRNTHRNRQARLVVRDSRLVA